MYGVEWLMGLGLLCLVAGLAAGYLVARRLGAGTGRVRELEAELETARKELADYREEVVAQFSETARKFQTLNDSYTDLHQHLAKSSSILCGDVSGPLLAAPAGHHDLLPREVRQRHRAQPRNEPAEREEPSAGGYKEPSAGSGKEPSAGSDQEPSAGSGKEPFQTETASGERDRGQAAAAARTGEAPQTGADPGDEGEDIRVSEPGKAGDAPADGEPARQAPAEDRHTKGTRRAAGPG